MLEAVIFVVFPLCMAMAAMTDMLSMTIPNRVTMLLAATFFAVAPFSGLGVETILWHTAAAALVFIGCFALFALNVMGGGDAKLLAGAALWFGLTPDLMNFLVYTGYFGAVLTFVIIILRMPRFADITQFLPIPSHFTDNSSGVPYGIAIGIAGLMTYPESLIFISALAV